MKGKGRYGQFIKWIFGAVDFIILNFCYLFTCWWNAIDDRFYSKPAWLLCNISFMVAVYVTTSIHTRRVVYADRVLLQVIKTVGIHAAVFLALISFIDITAHWQLVAKFYLLFFACLGAWWIVSRKIIKQYRSRGFNYKRIVIIGGGNVGFRLMDELESDSGYGYRIMGFFDDKPKNRSVKNYKGNLAAVEDFVRDNLIDEMYCAIPDSDNNNVSQMIKIAEKHAVDFYYVPQFTRRITRRFELDSIGNVPILAIRPYPLSNPINRLIKRAFDLTVSTVALILAPLVLIPVAFAIKLTSKGPIFFKQERTGYRGKPFLCYKFRTMKINDESNNRQATRNDPRKTKVGNFLRATSIDELPQFFNVFKGEMSIVGPRPHMVKQTEDYSKLIDQYMLRHTIKPGITGWAQVNGYRGQTDQLWKMEKRVEYDVWYAENWNFLLDIKIMLLTIFNVFRGEKNAF